jgi:Domain of unknown function (DUF4386)
VPLGEAMAAGGGTASPAGVRVGNLVIDADAANAVTALVFCLGAAMFYVLLYRSRIVPRWISAWGLVAISFYVAAYLLPMYGVFDVDAPAQVLMYTPLAVQEMVLAVWMIARGFRPVAVSTTSERVVSRSPVDARLTIGSSGSRLAHVHTIRALPCACVEFLTPASDDIWSFIRGHFRTLAQPKFLGLGATTIAPLAVSTRVAVNR